MTNFSVTTYRSRPSGCRITKKGPALGCIHIPSPTTTSSLLAKTCVTGAVYLINRGLQDICRLCFGSRGTVLGADCVASRALVMSIPGRVPSMIASGVCVIAGTGSAVSCSFGILIPTPAIGSVSYRFTGPNDRIALVNSCFVSSPGIPLAVAVTNGIRIAGVAGVAGATIDFVLPSGTPTNCVGIGSVCNAKHSGFHCCSAHGVLFS